MGFERLIRSRLRDRSRAHAHAGRIVVIAMFVVGIAMLVTMFIVRDSVRRSRAATQPTTLPSPTSQPATTRATTAPAPPHDYMSLVLDRYPDFPTTQPLMIPLSELSDAARIVLTDPIRLDQRGDLWITRADAPPVDRVIGKVTFDADQVHLTRDRVLFTYVITDESGKAQPQVIVQRERGEPQVVSRAGRLEIGTPGRAYDWDRAYLIDNGETIVVPTDRGVSILRPQSRPTESFIDLRADPTAQPVTQPTAPMAMRPATRPATEDAAASAVVNVQTLRDARGVLAWIPWENGSIGSRGAARFIDGKWLRLGPDQGWPEKILHLIPLLDGGVLQLVSGDDGFVTTTLAVLDQNASVDEKAVAALVAQLSDDDSKVREEAHAKLTQYGAGIWPILERLRDAQGAEGQLRIDQLLRAKVSPALGQMHLQEGPVRVVARFLDGGALILAEAGVTIPDPNNPGIEPAPIAPAWIMLDPGKPIVPAPPQLVNELDAKSARLTGFSNEWIMIHDVNGPERFLGNHFAPMLRKSERAFRDVVGVDRRGRWLLHKEPFDGETMIIDPTLPDATPRLPVWDYPVEGGSVGWTLDGWPVVRKGGAWVIDANGTRPLDDSKERLLEHVYEPQPATLPSSTTQSTTQPATQPATQPTSQPTSQPAGPILLRDKDGGAYFGGQDDLSYMKRDGVMTHFALPPEAVGSGEAHLIETNGRLFLFNEPGRVVRLNRKRDTNGQESLALDAVFTRNIPNVDHPTRIWLDPADRIVISYEGNKLTILFPEGRIPPAIAQRMLERDLRANDPE